MTAIHGCDSVVTLNLTINNSKTGTDNQTSCNSYDWNGTVYTSSGSYTQTLQTTAGCDSVVTLTLTINNSKTGTDNQTSLLIVILRIDGNTYTSSNNTATHTLTASNGCDSVVTLNLTINQSLESVNNQNLCHGDTAYVGNSNYYSNGNFLDTLNSVNGCDSIISTYLYFYNPIISNVNQMLIC